MSETEVKKEVEQLEEKSVVTKDATAAEPTHLKNDAEDLGAPVVKPTDSNPDATKKVSKVSDQVNKDAKDGSLPKDQKPSGMKEEEAEVEGEEKIAETKEETSEMNIDLSDDVKALVSTDADLSEEFKEKAATIFETAVKTRIQEQVKVLEAQYEEKLSNETETVKEAMVEKVDSYLNYVVEEWMKENELAVERGIRTEIAEDFITGLKSLFKEHYIDVPEEKYNVLEDLTNQGKDLEAKLNEQIEKNVNLTKEVSEFHKRQAIAEVSADLADTEIEKFVSMAENVEYDSAEKFKEKLETIKESYFPKTKIEEATSKDEVDSVAANEPAVEASSDAMAAYTAAISKNLKAL
ncbi:prohead core protein [uncultured Mediterranean phage]|nr:prohead core protein [uncultured Mediterranean phage]